MDHRIIPIQHTVDNQISQTWKGENPLHNHRTSHTQSHHLHEIGQQSRYGLRQRMEKHDAALCQPPASGIEGAVFIHASLDAACQKLTEKGHTADGQAKSGRQIPHQTGVSGHIDPLQLDGKDIQE